MKQKLLLTLSALLIFSSLSAQRTITGVVTDAETGDSIAGANIIVVGTTTGTITNIKGEYTLDIPNGATTLVCSSVGQITTKKKISGNLKVNFSLVNDTNSDEIHTGHCASCKMYFITPKMKKRGYSQTTLGEEEITQYKPINISEALKTRVSGVQVGTASGSPGASSRIIIRGLKSLSKSNQPLIIVDGVPINNP